LPGWLTTSYNDPLTEQKEVEAGMACHEIASLRLGLMRILGLEDEAERQHELAELGDGADRPGPLRSLCGAGDLASLRRFFEAALADLEQRIAQTSPRDPDLPYLRSLLILNKKVELDLHNYVNNLHTFYRNLDEMHDLVHEIYPAKPGT
jgi:hypothetical protein